MTFLVGDPKLNLHLSLASWETDQPKVYLPPKNWLEHKKVDALEMIAFEGCKKVTKINWNKTPSFSIKSATASGSLGCWTISRSSDSEKKTHHHVDSFVPRRELRQETHLATANFHLFQNGSFFVFWECGRKKVNSSLKPTAEGRPLKNRPSENGQNFIFQACDFQGFFLAVRFRLIGPYWVVFSA